MNTSTPIQSSLSQPTPSNYTPILIQYACAGIEAIFLPGYRYKKAGVIMLGLITENVMQSHLLVEPPDEEYQ